MNHPKSCKCTECRAKRAQRNREYRARRAQGWTPETLRRPPGPTVQHLQLLDAIGVPTIDIARQTGIDRSTLMRMRRGEVLFVMPENERKVLAIDPGRVPTAIAARAHVIALQKNGWRQRDIADAAGISQSSISDLLNNKKKKAWSRTLRNILALDPTFGPTAPPPPSQEDLPEPWD